MFMELPALPLYSLSQKLYSATKVYGKEMGTFNDKGAEEQGFSGPWLVRPAYSGMVR